MSKSILTNYSVSGGSGELLSLEFSGVAEWNPEIHQRMMKWMHEGINKEVEFPNWSIEWMCLYCATPQSYQRVNCSQCGAPRSHLGL